MSIASLPWSRLHARRPKPIPPGFIQPCAPTRVEVPPSGPDWLHEVKRDGYRMLAFREGDAVRLWSRHGTNWTHRLASIAEAVRALPCSSVMLDGEAVALHPDGRDDFHGLLSKDGCQGAAYVAFDILSLNGEDLRQRPLYERRAALQRLLAKAPPCIAMSDAIAEEGALVFAHACKLGFEGIVSKRIDSPYRSGRTINWLKAVSPGYSR